MNCLFYKGNTVELKRAWAIRIFIDGYWGESRTIYSQDGTDRATYF